MHVSVPALAALLSVSSLRPQAFRHTGRADAAEDTGDVPALERPVCCCKVEEGACKGVARNLQPRYFYEAAAPARDPAAAAGSPTCHKEGLCCHLFEGSCQWKGARWWRRRRYHIRNVEPGLCTGMPEVPKSVHTITPEEMFGAHATGEPRPAFLGALNGTGGFAGAPAPRDYTVVVDRSGSMNIEDKVHVPESLAKYAKTRPGSQKISRWRQVEAAIAFLAPYALAQDPDGITVILFDNDFKEYRKIRTVREVEQLFSANLPQGRTFLAEPLKRAMVPDNIGRSQAVFVITDGAATDPAEVTRAIVAHTDTLCRPEMLSLSFTQVGNDEQAGRYLAGLRDDVMTAGAKFDIVDTMTTQDMQNRNFLEVIEHGVLN